MPPASALNTKYFTDRLKDLDLSLRGLATRMKMGAPTLSRKFNGERQFKPKEVALLSQHLQAPMDEILRQLKIDVPLATMSKGGAKVSVVGEVLDGGEIVFKKPAGASTVDAPPNEAATGMQALRCVSEGPLDGAYVFYRPSTSVKDGVAGKPCVCALSDGRQLLATPSRGATRGSYTLRDLTGKILATDAWLETASPVSWIKLSP